MHLCRTSSGPALEVEIGGSGLYSLLFKCISMDCALITQLFIHLSIQLSVSVYGYNKEGFQQLYGSISKKVTD